MEWQVVLPHIGPPSNLSECLATLGDISVPFLLVNNSPHGCDFGIDIPDGIDVEDYPDNLGVAASWNRGIAQGAEKLLVLSASVRFGDGGLERVLEYADRRCNDFGIQFGGYPNRPDGLWNVGWKCIVFTKMMTDLVGTFDANFWPAYFEDLDFSYRTYLALGGTERKFPLAQGDVESVGVEKSGDGIAVKAGYGFPPGVRQSGDVVRDYYIEKWGGPSGEEKFVHPFGNAAHDHRVWPSPPRRTLPGPGE